MGNLSFKVKAQGLAAAIAKIEKACEAKTTIPVLGCARIISHEDTLQICGSNLAMTLHTVVKAEIISPGSGAAPVRLLLPLLRSLSGDVEVEVADNFHFKVKSKSGKYKVMGLDVERYPPVPPMATTLSGVKAEDLASLISKCEFAASQRDDNRFSLCGANVEYDTDLKALVMVTADGHRMSVASAPAERPCPKMFIARAALPVIKSLTEGEGDVLLGETDAALTFASGTEVLTVGKQTVSFPEWRKIMPDGRPTRASIDAASLADALRRAVTFSDKETAQVRVIFSEGKVTLKSSSSDCGESEDSIEAEVSGPEATVGFNSSYLLDFVSKVDGLISWEVGSPTDGALLLSGNWSYVAMPMRLKDTAAAAEKKTEDLKAEAVSA